MKRDCSRSRSIPSLRPSAHTAALRGSIAAFDFTKIQRKLFYEENKNLQKDEHLRLLDAANKAGNKRIALIIETIGATGIRVSELKYITMEAVSNGITRIYLKGKIRTILLPGKLRTKLLKYARKRKSPPVKLHHQKR